VLVWKLCGINGVKRLELKPTFAVQSKKTFKMTTEVEQVPAVISFDDEHEAFAARSVSFVLDFDLIFLLSRTTQFVYVPNKDSFFSTLDQHADALEGDVKPLVVLGSEGILSNFPFSNQPLLPLVGSGKSAFLASWVAKRRLTKHRDEFLFQHFVGCSAKTCQLAHTLFRLETALKDFFQLREMEVPDSEERLRWSLNRFLSAAAKKHSPARIVIVIDGVNNLKGDGGRDGELYWLPTELPPSVRFIVSTVELERDQRGTEEVTQHRTFIELSRRQCPVIRMEPLIIPTRELIVNSYRNIHPELKIYDIQQYKMWTSATAQPLYLRCLLQALRLGIMTTSISVDLLLENYLKCSTAFELIEHCLDICSRPFANDDENDIFCDLVAKMLIVIFVSRNGLSLTELWNVIKMVSGIDELPHIDKLQSILNDFTMVVNSLHSFSHAVYSEVIYEKYICSNESLVRWHHIMAKFFNKLDPCDRKLECLPYHLEVAGSWSKVKNCLTEIDMFDLWWTPKFKGEFIKLWSSLTTRKSSSASSSSSSANQDHAVNGSTGAGGAAGGGGGGGATAGGAGSTSSSPPSKHRPTYDIVEEYVKSLDEYIAMKHPSDEAVAEIILQIADFLIEFATNGHELNADVPALIHPPIPSEDLCSLGVPHIIEDEDAGGGGRSTLFIPVMGTKQDDGLKALGDAPLKQANEDFPICTTYYFHRWMWIQFPLIALGNCGRKFELGIKVKNTNYDNSTTTGGGGGGGGGGMGHGNCRRGVGFGSEDDGTGTGRGKGKGKGKNIKSILKRQAISRSFSAASYKLPELKFVRKAAKTIRKIPNPDDNLEAAVLAAGDSVSKRLDAINEEIYNLREEYDFMRQQKRIKSKKLIELQTTLNDLKVSESSTTIYEKNLGVAMKNEERGEMKLSHCLMLHENMKSLLLMCDRHPAHCPALVLEIEEKLKQDQLLIAEIKKRLWEQSFEKQSHNSAFRRMKLLVQEGVDMHMKLLEYRYNMKRYLQNQTLEDAKTLNLRETEGVGGGGVGGGGGRRGGKKGEGGGGKGGEGGGGGFYKNSSRSLTSNSSILALQADREGSSARWDDIWQIISSRTGITDPDIFFQRLNNGYAPLSLSLSAL
jgi:uncharacterized membrane protein YgcG